MAPQTWGVGVVVVVGWFVCFKKPNCVLPPEASQGVTSVISQLILNIPLSFLDIFHIELKGA